MLYVATCTRYIIIRIAHSLTLHALHSVKAFYTYYIYIILDYLDHLDHTIKTLKNFDFFRSKKAKSTWPCMDQRGLAPLSGGPVWGRGSLPAFDDEIVSPRGWD